MAWRGLHLSEASRLSYADGQMVVAQGDGVVRLALEDVAWVVVDTPAVTLTSALLAACMAAGIALIVTDASHTPCGVALPFHRHHRQADIARIQIAASLPLRKRLWQAIVRAKIENQAASLDRVGAAGGQTLRAMAGHVASGDPKNIEAQAARLYWSRLWRDFRREDEGDRRNALLNYGYAIIRSGVARALVASGLLPAFGLKHASVSNAFNLADDLVEPLRPFVDRVAWGIVGDGAADRSALTLADRRTMAAALLAETAMAGETVTLLGAAEQMSESLVRCLEQNKPGLLRLPVMAA